LRRLVKRVAVGLSAVGLAVTTHIAPAHAVDPPNGTTEVLAGVGSDTTFDIMGKLAKRYNKSNTGNPVPRDKVKNVPPRLASGESYDVPADGDCGAFTYTNPGNLPPDGSSAGINALVADTTGCLDFARSSRGKGASDPSSLEFYAYAKDALTWGRFPDACPGTDTGKSGCAGGNLTVDQLRGIYNCTQPGGQPLYTNWSQVGGDPGTIIRYLPQTGSGTLSFFETKILGLSSAQQGVLDDSSCATHPTRIQEHDATAVAAGNRNRAILPFSFAKWYQMDNALIPDLRSGVKLGKINSVKPTTTSISDNSFFGVRYVYNVAKTTTPHYGQVLRLVGVNATGNGYICSGAESSNIGLYGFVPLTQAPAGPGLPNSFCRLNPTPL
jgi:phosphate transport system substrate-binding protein